MKFYPGSSREPQYYFYSKDHLGNIRSVVTKNPSTNEITEIQQTHYYPFGGIIADISSGRSVQNKLYNAKELDTSNNLWWYDYVTRPYDPTRGQFTNYDQHCESYYNTNPLTYCGNNPIKLVDPDGKDPTLPERILIGGGVGFVIGGGIALFQGKSGREILGSAGGHSSRTQANTMVAKQQRSVDKAVATQLRQVEINGTRLEYRFYRRYANGKDIYNIGTIYGK